MGGKREEVGRLEGIRMCWRIGRDWKGRRVKNKWEEENGNMKKGRRRVQKKRGGGGSEEIGRNKGEIL